MFCFLFWGVFNCFPKWSHFSFSDGDPLCSLPLQCWPHHRSPRTKLQNQRGGSQGFPNRGLIQRYLIFLQTQDPHDVLGQCLFGEHISTPFVLQARDQRTCMSLWQIWSLQELEGRDSSKPGRHTPVSTTWACTLLRGPAAPEGSYQTVWKTSLSIRNASFKEQKSLLL